MTWPWFLTILFVGSALAGTANRRHLKRLIEYPDAAPETPLPRDEWFIQKLDHFDPTNSGTWWQRYQTNGTWFRTSRNSPVFLMIGGEGAISAKWMVDGAWMNYAQQYKALCFQLEHRFYGKSQPTVDSSVENLKYLSSEQALADLAYFIEGMNQKYKLTENNKWIVFGGSYPGSLAAWARLKYPHLIHAAVSTSGPVLAISDFKAYNEVVRQSLAASSPSCAANVHQAALAVQDALAVPSNADILTKKFNLCQPLNLTNKKDMSNFASTLAGNFQDVVQANKVNLTMLDPVLRPNHNSFVPSTAPSVDDICRIMDNSSIGDAVERYAAVNKLLNPACLDITYYDYIQELRDPAYSENRSWIYQTCTEFGFYQTSSSRSELFGSLFNLQFFTDQCKDIFGDDFDVNRLNEGIRRTNIVYGAKDVVNAVSRVVFVQGSLDPWHVLGVFESTNKDSPAVLINGTAHCANMFPPSPKDPPQLVAARETITQLLEQWLSK